MTLVLQPLSFPLEEKSHWRTTCSSEQAQLNCSGTVRSVSPSRPTTPASSNMMPLTIPGSPVGKRKLDSAPTTTTTTTNTEECDYRPPTKRISPFLNTPKQRRDERRKLFRISMNKLRNIDDSEAFLRRSVLITNLARRMQKELRDEKNGRFPQPCARITQEPETTPRSPLCSSRRARTPPPYLAPPVSPLPASIFDDTFSLTDKITDDMSDTLMRTVDALGSFPSAATDLLTTPCSDDITSCLNTTQTSPTLQLPTSQPTSQQSELCSSSAMDCSGMTERDRQILGEMDAVFNSLLSMFAESVGTQHGS